MKCRFLTGNYLLACKAASKVYMPSSFEINEYCESSRHKVCPLFFKVKMEETMVPQRDEYPLCGARR